MTNNDIMSIIYQAIELSWTAEFNGAMQFKNLHFQQAQKLIMINKANHFAIKFPNLCLDIRYSIHSLL